MAFSACSVCSVYGIIAKTLNPQETHGHCITTVAINEEEKKKRERQGVHKKLNVVDQLLYTNFDPDEKLQTLPIGTKPATLDSLQAMKDFENLIS
ncbi:hypothetical protein NC653_020710 [Populus alba x Populus x berolinensis]|uniref:Uncharacterized protein n=1 Tax=Populus alba x Populus x berolinensis TaxID=444605 RepID=A0AAD6MLI6_9ROSI|nr:hypothetical protein NC653_020710 [Populus alba x Populus x berolinensis]